jgi:hypothetical protein
MLMSNPFINMDEASKHLMDAFSVVTVLGTLADMLPSIAALFTIIWTGIRIYETKTIQKLVGKKDAEHE